MEQQQTPEESLTLYAQGVDELTAALAGLSEQELDLRPTEEEWSIRQIVHHIADGDDLWTMALKAALANSGCSYRHDWYTPDNAWAESLDYAGRKIEPAVALFRANRAAILQVVRHLPDPWDRSIRFEAPYLSNPEQVTAGEIVSSLAKHTLMHCEEIHRIRQAHNR